MINWELRYRPVSALIDEMRPGRVLDVGSGQHGLGRYWAGGQVVQTDLEAFTGPPPGAAAVQADCARLPFGTGTVDVVVSLDLLEHLPRPVRRTAVAELLRVSRGVAIVGFPEGAAARGADLRLARTLSLARRPQPPWLTEHLTGDYPEPGELRDLLPPGVRVHRQLANEPLWVHNLVAVLEHTPLIGRLCSRFATPLARLLPASLPAGGYYRSVYHLVRTP